jgi:hypothetical protein
MGKSKSTKKATAKVRKPVKPTVEAAQHEEPKEKVAREELCVFAFRLTADERDLIHKAAGSAKASKFVRALAVAAARNDEAAVKTIMEGIESEA